MAFLQESQVAARIRAEKEKEKEEEGRKRKRKSANQFYHYSGLIA